MGDAIGSFLCLKDDANHVPPIFKTGFIYRLSGFIIPDKADL
jgi:hypothetical protein